MGKKERKKILKYFIIFYFISFLIINWNDISWVFNYRVLSSLLLNYLHQSNGQASSAFTRETGEEEGLTGIDYSGEGNKLEIPRLGVSAPIILAESTNKADFKSYLDKGVVLFPGSVLPGQEGQTIILGHSAPYSWPKIKYDWVFSRINELQERDEVFIFFNNEKYIYSVRKKFFLQRGDNLPKDLTDSKGVLVIISCWPPGKDVRRIAVEAAQVPY